MISKMKCIGSQRETRLYYDLEEIYKSVREEKGDIISITSEI